MPDRWRTGRPLAESRPSRRRCEDDGASRSSRLASAYFDILLNRRIPFPLEDGSARTGAFVGVKEAAERITFRVRGGRSGRISSVSVTPCAADGSRGRYRGASARPARSIAWQHQEPEEDRGAFQGQPKPGLSPGARRALEAGHAGRIRAEEQPVTGARGVARRKRPAAAAAE